MRSSYTYNMTIMRIANATSRDRDKDAQVREALKEYPVLCWSWVPGCIFTRTQQERVVDYIQVEQVGRWVMSGQWKRGKVFQPLLLYSSNFSSSSPSSRHVYKLGSVPTSTCLSTRPTYPPPAAAARRTALSGEENSLIGSIMIDGWAWGLLAPPSPHLTTALRPHRYSASRAESQCHVPGKVRPMAMTSSLAYAPDPPGLGR